MEAYIHGEGLEDLGGDYSEQCSDMEGYIHGDGLEDLGGTGITDKTIGCIQSTIWRTSVTQKSID